MEGFTKDITCRGIKLLVAAYIFSDANLCSLISKFHPDKVCLSF